MDNKSRDHLANERTFLAYVRTALSFIAFGFVVARFSLFTREISVIAHISVPNSHTSAIFGVFMAAAGIALGIYGAARYVGTRAALQADTQSPMPDWAAVLGGAVVTAVGVIVAYALFQVR